ncbi:MAG: RluA family pseudouridine synthase [Planctomycetota bacterium]
MSEKGTDIHVETYSFDISSSPTIDRIDAYLAERFPDYSRSFIKTLINDGGILVNGEAIKPAYTPRRGDHVTANVPVQRGDPVQPENIELDIIYEDRWIIVLNKAPDMVVHPSRGHQTGTLLNGVAHHCKHLSQHGGDLRPGVVHRLDRDTTGAIVMIKDDAVHEEIARQFADREVKKEYLAICEGRMELDQDLIEARIGDHRRHRTKMAIRPDVGKKAQTAYEVVERLLDFTIVRCYPRSGRTHQIRLHLRHAGYPIVCDRDYGVREEIFRSDLTGSEHPPGEDPLLWRQALHARRLTLYHPERKEQMTFEAPVPPDIMSLVNTLRELDDQHRAG